MATELWRATPPVSRRRHPVDGTSSRALRRFEGCAVSARHQPGSRLARHRHSRCRRAGARGPARPSARPAVPPPWSPAWPTWIRRESPAWRRKMTRREILWRLAATATIGAAGAVFLGIVFAATADTAVARGGDRVEEDAMPLLRLLVGITGGHGCHEGTTGQPGQQEPLLRQGLPHGAGPLRQGPPHPGPGAQGRPASPGPDEGGARPCGRQDRPRPSRPTARTPWRYTAPGTGPPPTARPPPS